MWYCYRAWNCNINNRNAVILSHTRHHTNNILIVKPGVCQPAADVCLVSYKIVSVRHLYVCIRP